MKMTELTTLPFNVTVRLLHLKPLIFLFYHQFDCFCSLSSFSSVLFSPTAGNISHEKVQINPDATSSTPEDTLNNFSNYQANKT